jgi:4-amino-4-deoxy-L-arabinose transferase-like glycosyltransferase
MKAPRPWQGGGLLLLWAAFAGRGVFLALALPGGDPLDETFHFAYAHYLAETGHIPVPRKPSIAAEFLRVLPLLPASTPIPGGRISWKEYSDAPEEKRRELRREAYEYRPEERRLWREPNYETQQPPLFYLLASAPLRALPEARFSTRLLALRLFSALLAATAVPLVHLFFRLLFSRPAAIAATAAFVAFPGIGSFIGRFTNDALALPIAAALLFLFAEAGRGRLSLGKTAALAALLAAGCWTKLYLLLLLPIAPLAALATRRGRRTRAWRRPLLACAFAFLLFVPWLILQRLRTGDWFGLYSSTQATALKIGVLDRLRTIPDFVTARFAIVFGRTFLWPGTWSASGAPATLAVLLAVTLMFLLLAPNLSGGPRSRMRQRVWWTGGLAVAVFLAGQLAQASTYASVGKLRGHAPSAGPDGWYLLILFPVLLSAGCVLGRRVGADSFVVAAAVFLAAEWWTTFGVLPGVYGGRTAFNGANAPFSAYGAYLRRPDEVLRVYSKAGLAGAPVFVLASVMGLWLLAIASALLLLRSRRTQVRAGR